MWSNQGGISQLIYEVSAFRLWMKRVCCWLGEVIYDVIVKEGMMVLPFSLSFLFFFNSPCALRITLVFFTFALLFYMCLLAVNLNWDVFQGVGLNVVTKEFVTIDPVPCCGTLHTLASF